MFLRLGFALLPDENSIHLLREMNRFLRSNHSESLSLDEPNVPHVSLFQGVFRSSSLDQIVTDVGRLKQKCIDCEVLGFEIWAKKIIFLNLNPHHKDLRKLHEAVVKHVNPLRDTTQGSADTQVLEGLIEKESQSLKQYSFPFVLETFKPHFTLGQISTTLDIDLLKSLFSFPAKIPLTSFVIFEVGIQGVVTKILNKMELET